MAWWYKCILTRALATLHAWASQLSAENYRTLIASLCGSMGLYTDLPATAKLLQHWSLHGIEIVTV